MSGLKCGREQIEWITGVELRGYEGAEQCKCWENYSAQATVGGLVPSPPPQLLSHAVQETVVDNWEQETVVDNWEEEETVVDNWKQEETVVDNWEEEETVVDNWKQEETVVDNWKQEEAVVDNWKQEETVVDNWEQEETVVDNWKQDNLQDATYHFTTCRSVCVCVCVCMRVKSIQVNVYPLCVLLMSAYVQEDWKC